MKPILIVYGTIEGHTRKVSNCIAKVLKEEGFRVEVIDSDKAESVEFDRYSAIVAGAPIHVSRFPKKFTELIARNAHSLASRPTAFFSVCLGILQKDEPETQQAERDFVSNFFAVTGWQPEKWTIFSGALMYSKYGWLKKRVMRMIARKAGQKTDIDHDYDFTDWSEVRKFAYDFGQTVQRSLP